MNTNRFGIAGRMAAWGERSRLTPLLALVGLLLGLIAALITPREEEPQIDVTMVDVAVRYPGASVTQVADQLTTPLEQHLAKMQGIKHVYSVSNPGHALVTVQFDVGVPRHDALAELFDTVSSWQAQHPQFTQPIVNARGIDDVPILALTVTANEHHLNDVADTLIAPLQNVPGVRQVEILGAELDQVTVILDTATLSRVGLDLTQVAQALRQHNYSAHAGYRLAQGQQINVQVGGFIDSVAQLRQLVLTTHAGKPVRLEQVATIQEGTPVASRYVWQRKAGADAEPALTLTITKKPGENAVTVAAAVLERLNTIQQQWLPDDVEITVTRNYGQSADEKASTLIQKLIFATGSVMVLVLFTLGRREAAVVGVAVVLTLAMTLFASLMWGFTLNRVSLFALIFSIGILVDDAIVVVENIHRHLAAGESLKTIIPRAVDEVGGPTILATFTVIAALLPMAFVSGLMGPYMSPIPINASMGMLLSLLIALTVTPWLAQRWLRVGGTEQSHSRDQRLRGWYQRLMTPLLQSRRRRYGMGAGLIALIAIAMLLVGWQAVILKMLPFDNKSELKLVVDMPEGTPLEQTNATLMQLAIALDSVEEVIGTQIYAGTASPIGFNGLVRQYYLREASHLGDIQVTLAHARERSRSSHEIARAIRPLLQPIAEAAGATLKVVEVPPGPPVLAPIVAEVYGPTVAMREQAARTVLAQFGEVDGIVDQDTTLVSDAVEEVWAIQRERAAQLGVSAAQVAQVVETALAGVAITHIAEPGQLHPTPVIVRLPPSWQGQLSQLQSLTVTSDTTGAAIPIAELLERQTRPVAQPIYHKDLRPVIYVTGDMAGQNDSPLYGLFGVAGQLELPQSYIAQPNLWDQAAIKWDGEWQITYETFRDMGIAYAVGLFLIYLLVVAHFGSYRTPLVIMAPIPLTLIGILPGHALLNAQFTATSMIGMIALAGIIVRNSILLVDFIQAAVDAGEPLEEAVIEAATVRTKPIILTALAAMLGAFFILDDPIFNGLAISLVFGLAVSTLLTLIVIPQLYAAQLRRTLQVQ
ncbi:Multidrug efflux pump subunit AcrB [Pseudidiomarina indica]|uniref:Multidrug efflux pump subunit AcrB n=1 Tax=Pseudidiomarina indica TaxID=1159017 RepID=A0A1G6D6M2_9GAMM|nr:efflux RND transporter permease subunit [Pseudidiomarina indica]SDB40834.1 Multidrug efflux pump subunit AcrB [Pseudidiomarina indica]